MNFDIDRQTLNDLAIFPSINSRQSIYNLFNNTNTIGGAEALQDMFNNPLANPSQIKERIAVFLYIEKHDIGINFNKNDYDFVEFYLRKHYRAKSFSILARLADRIGYAFNNNDYYIIKTGVESTLSILNSLINYADALKADIPEKLREFQSAILNAFPQDELIFL